MIDELFDPAQSFNFGWGTKNQTAEERHEAEKRYFGQFAEHNPERVMRHESKLIRNELLMAKVKVMQEADGIEDGFSFLHLEKAIFGKELSWLRQLIGSCVASGGMRVDTHRMLAEVFLFGEYQDLLGHEFAGVKSFVPYAPFNYRAGRKFAGINGNSDGSLCAPHYRGKVEYGFLPCSASGLESDAYPEPQRESEYRRWGANDSLLNDFRSATTAKLIETEKVRDAEDAKTLLVDHLKPMQICSMWAFEPDQKHRTWDWDGGVTIYRRSRQQWAHNMSVSGIVKVSGDWFVLILNSWGNMHSGRQWFPIPIEVFDDWLRQAECQTTGDIKFEKKPSPPI
jgi:hypothetical protein